MKKQEIITRAWIITALVLATSVFAAGKPAPISLSPEGKKLEAHYSKMQADLTEAITRLEPDSPSSSMRLSMSRLLPRRSRTTSPRSCGKSP
jgi:hypothetical protein